MKMRSRMRGHAQRTAAGRRRRSIGSLILATGAVLALAPSAMAAAFSTTDDTNVAGACVQGTSNNCNGYSAKTDVFLSGLKNQLDPGTYFFAVVDPSGQNDPNDGTVGNLSSPNDPWTNREFTVNADGSVSYPSPGAHVFDLSHNGGAIGLAPFNDTTSPGGVYIATVCEVPANPNPAMGTGAPGVQNGNCKHDAFKIEPGNPGGGGGISDPVITKNATGTDTLTYGWSIAKDVDQANWNIADGGTATPNYTVTVTHDGGTVSNVQVNGTIQIFNADSEPVNITDVTDQLSDGTVCTVTGGGSSTNPVGSIPVGETDFAYSCSLGGLPKGELDNTATVNWPDNPNLSEGDMAAGSASYTFQNIAFSDSQVVNNCVNVTDSNSGTATPTNGSAALPATVCASDPSTTTYTYSESFGGTAGTCTTYDNTATYTATDDSSVTGSGSKSVDVCVGEDLAVSKTANTSFKRTYAWSISKTGPATITGSGSVSVPYTVTAQETGFTDSNWQVAGQITVTNPNDWETIDVNLADAVPDGGSCTVDPTTANTDGTYTVPEATAGGAGSITVPYTCTYASMPTGFGTQHTNTATGTWDAATYFTPDGQAQGTANYTFSAPTSTQYETITVQDVFNGGAPATLGTVTATDTTPYASQTFNPTESVTEPVNGPCVTVNNVAQIVDPSEQSNTVTTVICSPVKGGLTIGFWQNKNGQGVIGSSKTGICAVTPVLRGYLPFADLSATATCAQVQSYVAGVIAAANAAGATMNPMLKAQMLATALDVYYSGLPGNPISAFNGGIANLGNVTVDLTAPENVSAAFGGATSMTVSQMLSYAASQSNSGGSIWYGQSKITQGLAKDAFNNINNGIAIV